MRKSWILGLAILLFSTAAWAKYPKPSDLYRGEHPLLRGGQVEITFDGYSLDLRLPISRFNGERFEYVSFEALSYRFSKMDPLTGIHTFEIYRENGPQGEVLGHLLWAGDFATPEHVVFIGTDGTRFTLTHQDARED